MSRLAHMAAVAAFIIAAPLTATGSPFADLDEFDDARKRGAIVWDVRSADEYRAGHVPGAVNIGDPAKVLRHAGREVFLPTWKIESILGAAGIDLSREIVVYGTRGAPQAYFGRFALRYFGSDDVKVYHDGIDGWRQAGRRIDTDPTRLPEVAVRLVPRTEMVVTTDQIIAAMTDANVQIVDVRSPAEFSGDDVRAIRGGHIPGALNIPFERNWRDPHTRVRLARGQVSDNRGMALADRGTLESLYGMLDPSRETIVYCQSGTRAGVTAAVLESLGFDRVKVYDASWLGYAGRLDAPAEQESFVNVGLLQSQLQALAGQMKELERMFQAQQMPLAGQR